MSLRNFYTDLIVIFFSILSMSIVLTILTIIVIKLITSSDEGEDLAVGLLLGLGIGLLFFYYLRGKFNFAWSIAQTILNIGLTVLEILFVSFLVDEIKITKMSFIILLIIIGVPSVIAFNKQLFDLLATKMNAKIRAKTPVDLIW